MNTPKTASQWARKYYESPPSNDDTMGPPESWQFGWIDMDLSFEAGRRAGRLEGIERVAVWFDGECEGLGCDQHCPSSAYARIIREMKEEP